MKESCKQISYKFKDKAFIKKLANLIAEKTSLGDIILLKGDLGVGKTYFSKEFVNYFYNDNIIVSSPTFNIVQTYKTNLFTIWHFDLYRLKSIEEVVEIGIEESFDTGVSIIEWPDIIYDILPQNILEINLYFAQNPKKRNIDLNLYGKWKTENFY